MNVVLASALAALCLALGGCASRQPQAVGDAFVGNWRGSVLFHGARARDVELNIQRGTDGRLRAVAFYADIGCRSELVETQSEPQAVRFTETMVAPSPSCGSQRDVSLTGSQDERVTFVSAQPPGQGALYRFPMSSAMTSQGRSPGR